MPFIVDGPEALDINTEWDWRVAEWLLESGQLRADRGPAGE